MLSQFDIDTIYDNITKNNMCKLYYVAHNIECREGVIDENIYKSVSDFRVVEVYVNEVKNALLEYLHYLENPSLYKVSYEDVWYDRKTKYRHFYIMSPTIQRLSFNQVQKDLDEYVYAEDYGGTGATAAYHHDENSHVVEFDYNSYIARRPSAIYGYQRGFIDVYDDQLKNKTIIESPVKPLYTNSPTFLGEVEDNMSYLNWKYKVLNPPAIVDGIEFGYTYSDWYILGVCNFPRTEDALIKVNDKNAYFMNLDDAFNHIEQLKA